MNKQNGKNRYLRETVILNYSAPEIQGLIQREGWKQLDDFRKIQGIYNYVRDEILFGYNKNDAIPASQVLRDGIGQCNTKATLLMALLRAVNIPCRLHGFTVYKKVQKGASSGFVTRQMPDEVVHTWVEVYFEDTWFCLEGVIIDRKYLQGLYKMFPEHKGAFCGYGVCVNNFRSPQIEWDRNDTYIQSEAIGQDFGVYDAPDDFLKEHRQSLSALKEFVYEYLGRHIMNRNVRRIRCAGSQS